MPLMPVLVMPDPEDQLALQAWVDVEVGGATVRLLLDTGSGTTAIPWSAAVGAPVAEATAPGRGASGGTVDGWHGVVTSLSLPGAHSCDDLTVDVQPAGWPHAPLLGRDVFEGHSCDLRFGAGVVEFDPTEPPAGLRPSESWRGCPGVAVRWADTVVDAVWDTGAGATAVDRAWAEDHPEAIVITDEANDGTDVTGTSVAAFHGRMNSYTIADLEFPQQACVIVDLSALNAHLDEPVRFGLGLPQIVLANWYLDFRTQTLAVYPLA